LSSFFAVLFKVSYILDRPYVCPAGDLPAADFGTSKESTMANKYDLFRRRAALIFVGLLLHTGTILAVSGYSAERSLSTRTLRTMCRAYLAYGQYDKASVLAETAVTRVRREGAEIGEQALCFIDLGTVYSGQDRLEDAATMLAEGVFLQKQALGDQHPYTAHTLRMLSDVYRRQGRLDAAEASLGEAFSVMLAQTHIQSREMSPFLIESAKLAAAAGRFEESRKTFETAQQMILVSYGGEHLYTAQAMQGAAEAALACGEFQDAREQIGRSIRLQERFFGDRPQMLIAGWLVAARIERACGALGESEAYLRKAIAAAQQGRNVITLSRVHEQAGAIRAEGVFTASATSTL
jgi:tetratricopeptide (TPR) repeat protein